jgi:protein arginine N-methyltransferase 1
VALVAWFNDIGILHYHASLLADAERVDRFREAIHEVVRPGDVVVDIGTGTGLLAYFACQAGAARVFAIEEGPVVTLGREIALINRFAGRVEFFNDSSFRVELPEPADVLISETLWNFGVGEGIAAVLADARRFLKPGARIVPEAVELHVAAVQCDHVYATLYNRPPDRHGIDFSPLRHYQVNNVQMPHLDADGFLGPASRLLTMQSSDEPATQDLDASVTIAVTTPGVLHGVLGWFRAQLSPGVSIDNRPPSVDSSWAHAFFPLQNPIGVRPGDEIAIHLEASEQGSIWRWRTELRRADKVVAAYDQTSRASFPHTAGIGADGGAPAGPRTTLRGEVVAWVLHAMDGTRSLEQLETDALERFGNRFEEGEEVVELVREAAARLGR